MGYAGGSAANPTYTRLGDHTETIQIDFDPERISYGELLEVYWSAHDATVKPWSQQYKSVIFYHDEEQKQQALASMDALAVRLGAQLYVEVLPYTEFWRAEDYHQKYYLQQRPQISGELQDIYPGYLDFTDSTAVTRANGYVGGFGTPEQFKEDLARLGLSDKGQESLTKVARSQNPGLCPVPS